MSINECYSKNTLISIVWNLLFIVIIFKFESITILVAIFNNTSVSTA